MTQPTVEFMRVERERGLKAKLPEYATDEAAGMDLFVVFSDDDDVCVDPFGSILRVFLRPGDRRLFLTGLRVAIPRGFEGQVRPKSGRALKEGLSVLNSPGTIDSDFRGEIGVMLINHSLYMQEIRDGQKIAQLVIAPVSHAQIREVNTLSLTDRGSGGFGSTGL